MKKLFSFLAIATAISFLIFFQSCYDDYNNPVVPNANESLIVLGPNTKEVEKNPNLISVSTDSEKVILNYNSSNNFPDIKVGDIILGHTGDGYLRKVNSISSQANSLTLLTTNSTLEEAFSKIKIDTSFSLNPIPQKIGAINYKKTIRENGSTLEISATSGEPSLVVNDETGQMHLEFPNLIFRIIKPDQSGIFELTAQNVIIDISATIHKVVIDEDENGVNQFSLIYRVENTQVFNNVSMYLKGGINEQFPDLLHEDLLPSDLFIGSAAFGPIILTFYLNIAGGIHGQFWMQAGTNLAANMNSTSTYDVGAEYRNGNWSVVWEKSTEGNTTVDFTPIASITGNAKLFIKPKFKVKVYDIFGPTLFVRGFIYGEFSWPPSHLAVGPGLDGGLSFDVSFLTFKIASFQAILLEKKWIWWEFTQNNPPAQPSNPIPSNNGQNQSINTDISWQCSDPENDPLTYDIYFGTATNPPLVKSNHTLTTYDPGTLDYNKTYNWKIIAKDNHSNSTSSILWKFVTEEHLVIDQIQEQLDYGFWFEKDVERWQEFFPTQNNLARLDLYIGKKGNPGNIIVTIKTGNGVTLKEKIIMQNDAFWGWNTITYQPPIPLIPGNSYKIYVRSSEDCTNVEIQYHWRGGVYASYPGVNDVQEWWNTYDYAFRTYAKL